MSLAMSGSVFTIYAAEALLPQGWASKVRIGVRDGLIVGVTAGSPAQDGDERQDIVIPGLPNVHSHAFQRGLAGLTEARGNSCDDFWSWRRLMYQFVDRIEPEDLATLAELAYIEMLESGFTRVAEFHYLHHRPDGAPYADRAEMAVAIGSAAAAAGIGLTLLPVLYAHAGFGLLPPRPEQRRFLNTIDDFGMLVEDSRRIANRLPDLIVGVAPHSLRAIDAGHLDRLAGLARDAPIHIHVAEQVAEVEDCLAWSGARPVEWLLDHAPVDHRWCMVHATHMTDTEAVGLARSRAVAGLCPITEANLGDGIFNAAPFLAAGGGYGVGSDSNVLIDATEELRLLEYGQRLTRRARNVLAAGLDSRTGNDVYCAALAGGGQAVGVPSAIAAGLSADLVSLDPHHPSITARQGPALLDGLIFAAGRSAIDCVWRRGTRLVAAGRHRGREAILPRYRAVLAKLTA
ncbi:MAG: formimidoylglutamate deiminase [Sphingobium sp.]